MPRNIIFTITDEQDLAAAIHGDGSITVEKVIKDRLDDLVHSAEGVVKQQYDQKKALVEEKDATEAASLDALLKQKDLEKQQAIDASYAKIPKD